MSSISRILVVIGMCIMLATSVPLDVSNIPRTASSAQLGGGLAGESLDSAILTDHALVMTNLGTSTIFPSTSGESALVAPLEIGYAPRPDQIRSLTASVGSDTYGLHPVPFLTQSEFQTVTKTIPVVNAFLVWLISPSPLPFHPFLRSAS